jgi:8-oxo-dGTP pyrophosphatase MutT (NUDIX family)
VLVTDEYIHSQYITKFPGGGLQFGEGTRGCLKRELMEETGEEIEILNHIYTTDFYLPSVFDPTKQVMSIYYDFRFVNPTTFSVNEKVFDFDELVDNAQAFRLIEIEKLSKEDLSLPVDKLMVDLIKKM